MIELDEDLKSKLYWGFVTLMALIAIVSFYQSAQYDKERNEMLIVAQEDKDAYIVNIKNGPSPYIVSLTNVKTKEQYNDIQLFETCPKYNKVESGVVVELTKTISFKAVNSQQVETFRGGYDELCKNKPLNKKLNGGE